MLEIQKSVLFFVVVLTVGEGSMALGTHLAVLNACFWLCTQEAMEVPEIKLGPAMCRASALTSVLSVLP